MPTPKEQRKALNRAMQHSKFRAALARTLGLKGGDMTRSARHLQKVFNHIMEADRLDEEAKGLDSD